MLFHGIYIPESVLCLFFWGGAQAGRAKVNIEFVVMQMSS